MTIREIINGLKETISKKDEEISRLKLEIFSVNDEKKKLEMELRSLRRRQPKQEQKKPYVAPEVKVIDNGDSDAHVIEPKQKRQRRKREVVE